MDAFRRILRGSALVFGLFLLFCSVLAGSGYAAARYQDRFFVEGHFDPVSPDVIDDPIPDRINILLVGTEKRGYNADVIMVASFNKEQGKLYMLSVPRDTRVIFPDGKTRKINKCLALGGMELLLKTVKDITGIPIQYYMKVNTEGFREVVDILGGVWFDVPQDMKYKDPYQDLDINLKEGYQLLDGDKAEQLVRFRRYRMGDIQRGKVQQDFLKALAEQHLNSDIIKKAPELYGKLTKYINTNISLGDVIANMGIFELMSSAGADSIEGMTLNGEGRYVGNVSYYLHYVDEALELGAEHFGGSGTSPVRDAYKKEFNDVMARVKKEAEKKQKEQAEKQKPKPAEEVPATPTPSGPDSGGHGEGNTEGAGDVTAPPEGGESPPPLWPDDDGDNFSPPASSGAASVLPSRQGAAGLLPQNHPLYSPLS